LLIKYCIYLSAIQLAVFLFSPVVLSLEAPKQISSAELAVSVMQEEQLGIPKSAYDVFSLWMTSGLLGMAANLLKVELSKSLRPFELFPHIN
jgi:hypothetical protein